jgi:hypothetical protein
MFVTEDSLLAQLQISGTTSGPEVTEKITIPSEFDAYLSLSSVSDSAIAK